MKVTEILHHQIKLLDQYSFCETHFTTYQWFVAAQSAIFPFLGGSYFFVLQFSTLRDKVEKIGYSLRAIARSTKGGCARCVCVCVCVCVLSLAFSLCLCLCRCTCACVCEFLCVCVCVCLCLCASMSVSECACLAVCVCKSMCVCSRVFVPQIDAAPGLAQVLRSPIFGAASDCRLYIYIYMCRPARCGVYLHTSPPPLSFDAVARHICVTTRPQTTPYSKISTS